LSDHLNHVVSTICAIIIIPLPPPSPSFSRSGATVLVIILLKRHVIPPRLQSIEITASAEDVIDHLDLVPKPGPRSYGMEATERIFLRTTTTCPAVFTIRPGLRPRRHKFHVIAVVTGSPFYERTAARIHGSLEMYPRRQGPADQP